MKLIAIVLLSFLSVTAGWGGERLFSFLSDHRLGSKVESGDEGLSELPEIEIFGYRFSAYYDLDEDKAIRKVGLYLRSSVSGASAADLQRAFDLMGDAISRESGNAEIFNIPNFEDATERTHSMMCWKSEGSILILQKFELSSRVEIDVRHVELDYFVSELGADFGSFVIPKIQTKSGELRIPSSSPLGRGAEASNSPAEQDRESDRERDLGTGTKSVQTEPSVQTERRDSITWLFVIGGIVVFGIFILVTRVFLRGRVS